MADADRITESAKHRIVSILNQIAEVEYKFIVNYPRTIDQIVTIEGVEDQQLIDDLERLGNESGYHLNACIQLITRLGGTSMWQIQPRDRTIDLEARGEDQIAGERLANRLYSEAAKIAEDNPVKSGFFNKLRPSLDAETDPVSRTETIRLLRHMADQELTHERILKDCLATFRAMRKRRD
jgi:hypothetical protein